MSASLQSSAVPARSLRVEMTFWRIVPTDELASRAIELARRLEPFVEPPARCSVQVGALRDSGGRSRFDVQVRVVGVRVYDCCSRRGGDLFETLELAFDEVHARLAPDSSGIRHRVDVAAALAAYGLELGSEPGSEPGRSKAA